MTHDRGRMNPAELLRYERGLPIKGVAHQTGLSDTTIRSFERGRRRPTANTARRLADCYGVTVARVMDAYDPLEPPNRRTSTLSQHG
jgi:transcriptional regulator with XRE-family HTH domain